MRNSTVVCFVPQYATAAVLCRARHKNDFTVNEGPKTRCFGSKNDFRKQENAFAAFACKDADFWRQREEAEFIGVGNIPVRFVRFRNDSF